MMDLNQRKTRVCREALAMLKDIVENPMDEKTIRGNCLLTLRFCTIITNEGRVPLTAEIAAWGKKIERLKPGEEVDHNEVNPIIAD